MRDAPMPAPNATGKAMGFPTWWVVTAPCDCMVDAGSTGTDCTACDGPRNAVTPAMAAAGTGVTDAGASKGREPM
eukprot:CAMPEP_0170602130 /NCGR_PEP_ID=MMETSP0224-20130122/18229_1 /TAXON_ID=285029 /ORGANISM="Togula jolla, Strain CCCM 725" /LENGTH=74 /DNA_ID=CAMNT_0010926953 /DNA_START=32 /DNA_END=253 /DNA_ORIENTATION=-